MSGIVSSLLNHRGSGIVAKLGTDGHTLNSGGAGKKAVTEAIVVVADGVDGSKLADDAVDSEHYAAGSIDTAHIADNQITLAKMAGGTDGNIISFDASGDPVAIATGDDGQVLTSTGAGSPPAFEAAAGGGGKILQIANVSYATQNTITGDANASSGTSVAITPSADSSTLLILWNGMQRVTQADDTNAYAGTSLWGDIGGGGYNLLSGGTGAYYYYIHGAGIWDSREVAIHGAFSRSTIWSPNTTSACTIRIYHSGDGGAKPTGSILQYSAVPSCIQVLELDGS